MKMVAKKHYSVGEIYQIAQQAVRTVRFLRSTRLGRDRQFTERIMLAVTEVNGCELCSYGHARLALKAGLEGDEIRALLGGNTDGTPHHQLPAIAFAQHYADTRGHPDLLAWQNLIDFYGPEDALGALAAVRMMMWGNAVGIPISSLRSRLRGVPDSGSTLRYEIATILGTAVVTPVAVLHALASTLRGLPVSPGPARQ